jgi:excisionase family DNA binding protein
MTEREEAITPEASRRLPFERASQSQSLDDLPALISVPKAAAILGLTRATAYRYAAAGELPTRRFGGRRVYVVTAKLRALIEPGGEAA